MRDDAMDEAEKAQRETIRREEVRVKKLLRMMRVSAEAAALASFQATFNGHAWASPPTGLEGKAAKLVREAQQLLHEQMQADRKEMLPE